MAKQKIGVYGGSFNPPHSGHRKLELTVADALGLDRVLVIPDSIPPHKQPLEFAGAKDRAAMCALGLLPDSRFELCTIEIERGSRSYTVDTLTELEKLYPDSEFYLIIGSDMFNSFRQWYKWQEILEKACVCPAIRAKDDVLDFSGYTEEEKSRFIPVEAEPIEISSTELRTLIANGEDTSAYLDVAVADYIEKNALYANRFPEYRRIIEQKLDPERLNHSFGVSRAARSLALKYGEDPDKAELAGLLHDVMKNASREEQKEIIERGGHRLTDVELANPKVWHAMAGESYLRLELGFGDEDVLSAVRYHTTGRSGMSLLEKIVYMADFISEERRYPDVETVRALAYESLEKAILYTSSYTIRTLVQQGLPVHTATVDCYNDTLIKLRKDAE